MFVSRVENDLLNNFIDNDPLNDKSYDFDDILYFPRVLDIRRSLYRNQYQHLYHQ